MNRERHEHVKPGKRGTRYCHLPGSKVSGSPLIISACQCLRANGINGAHAKPEYAMR